jgi:hypothetical protein
VKTNSAPHSEHLRIRSWNSAICQPGFRERVVERTGRNLSARGYSISRRDFFRFRLRASACLTRFFSPGFK